MVARQWRRGLRSSLLISVFFFLKAVPAFAGRCVLLSYSGVGLTQEAISDAASCRRLCERNEIQAPALCEFDPENGSGKQTLNVYRDAAKCSKGLEVRLTFSSYLPLEEQLKERVFGNAYSRGLLSWAELNGCSPREAADRAYSWNLSYSISLQKGVGQQAKLVLQASTTSARKDRAVIEADRIVASMTPDERRSCESVENSGCTQVMRDALAFSTASGGGFASMSEVLRDHPEKVFTREQLRILNRLAQRRLDRTFVLQSSWLPDSERGVSSLGSFLIDRDLKN